MNIYAKEWHKVKPIFINGQLQNGYDLERSEAGKYLKEGVVYTVEKTIVLDWSSAVYLKEFPGVPFNTIHFGDYAGEGELPVDGLLKEQEAGGKKERTFTLAEALEIAKYFEDRGMDIMSKAACGEFTKTMDVKTYMKEKFNIDLNK